MKQQPPYKQQVTFVYVTDLERSVAFYSERVGLPVVLRQAGCTIMRVTADSFIGVCERAEPQTAGIILTFVPDNLDAAYERLIAAGVACDGPPRRNGTYDIVQFFAEDLDGYTLEFQRFCSPDWPS